MARGAERRALGGAALAAATALLLVGCGGGGSETTGRTQTASAGKGSGGISATEKRKAKQRLAKELGVSKAKVNHLGAGHGLAATSVRPGRIIPGGPGPFFSSDTIFPVTNGWQAADHTSYTGVVAGASPADRSVGELGIFRQNFVKVTQDQHVVNVRGAGALRITRAPLGKGVATWAQQRGEIEFVGRRGVRGTLHLKTDKVTIEGGGSTSTSKN